MTVEEPTELQVYDKNVNYDFFPIALRVNAIALAFSKSISLSLLQTRF